MQEKRSKLVKTIPGIGRKADAESPSMKKVVMAIEDGDTGKTKCAAFVEIADTEGLRRRGLSKRAALGKASGMYFDCHGPFWMKDVEFPLDLCYLNDKGEITEKVAMPVDKQGTVTYPRQDPTSIQAIEFPFGYCDRHGIKIGDVVVPMLRID